MTADQECPLSSCYLTLKSFHFTKFFFSMKKIFLLFSNFNLLCSARQALSQGLSLCEFVLKVNLHVCFFLLSYSRKTCSSCVSDNVGCTWCDKTQSCFMFGTYTSRYPYGQCSHWIDRSVKRNCISINFKA